MDSHQLLASLKGGKRILSEKDPVCGMDVDPKTAAGKSEYQGKVYYFCSLGCKRAFDKDPHKYTDEEQSGFSQHR